ncbi:hypothetical protein ACYF6T_05845 [Streptomyces sp. 7R007]
MGEPQGEGSGAGRRHARPGATVSGSADGTESAALERLLAAAMRPDAVDAEGERRAVAAFRAARDAGAHRARTRRRDDWRPREHRRTRRSLKATFAIAVTGLTLGGVAYAGIGAVGSSHAEHGEQRTSPSAGASGAASDPSSAAVSTAPDPSATPDRPGTAQDTEAHCQAYEQVKDHGKALDATAWQRLVKAAGGERNVTAYCARRLGLASPAPTTPRPTRSANPNKPDTPGKASAAPTNGTGNSGQGNGKGN